MNYFNFIMSGEIHVKHFVVEWSCPSDVIINLKSQFYSLGLSIFSYYSTKCGEMPTNHTMTSPS